jgi:hypothetical protein
MHAEYQLRQRALGGAGDLSRFDWWTRGLRWFEVQLQRFLQVGKSLFFAFTLAGDIDFEALRNVPPSFAPDGRGKRLLHDNILS